MVGPFQHSALSALAACAVLTGCAESIPVTRYGVDKLRLEGVESLDPRALRSCLGTRERPRLELSLGAGAEPECGVPPFEADRLLIPLWRWPWTDWPLFDEAVFERDLQRIERWYRARGYYDARVSKTVMDPPSASTSDVVDEGTRCQRGDGDEGCELSITVTVEEGDPVRVDDIAITGTTQLPRTLREELHDVVQLAIGERFDEALYDRSKDTLQRMLAEESYARARVGGRVEIDPATRRALVRFEVDPGPSCVVGHVRVQGHEALPTRPIVGASLLRTGEVYDQREIEDAQRAVYDLGAFSSVQVEPQFSADPADPVVDILIRVVPGRLTRVGLGAGVQSGSLELIDGTETVDVSQWDVHLLGVAEHRNFLGGLRRLRLEERPRLIFRDIFPRVTTPSPGNVARLTFRQPAFLEARTNLVASARWDLGPEPFGARFDRHDFDARLGPERSFLDGRVFLSGGIHGNVLLVIGEGRRQLPLRVDTGTSTADLSGCGPGREPGVPSDYHLLFFEQNVRVDLRDNPLQPHRGAYFASGIHQAGFLLPASWDYIRVTPEARGYVPMPLGGVLAARFGIGALFVLEADKCLDSISRELGPERYRLRGGGASSNRGFIPGTLGDGVAGGLRRWEASVEYRQPLTQNFGTVVFVDLGDVHDGESFRFNYLQASVGLGLRYDTVVGPLRFDVGYRVPGLQVLGAEDPEPDFQVKLPFLPRFAGAVHITIGEAF